MNLVALPHTTHTPFTTPSLSPSVSQTPIVTGSYLIPGPSLLSSHTQGIVMGRLRSVQRQREVQGGVRIVCALSLHVDVH